MPPPLPAKPVEPRHWRNAIARLVLILACAGLTLVFLAYFALQATGTFQNFRVSSGSMEPTLRRGDLVFLDGISFWRKAPRRGQILIYKTEGLWRGRPGEIYIHRLVGLPGEALTLSEGKILADGRPTRLRGSEGKLEYHANGFCLSLKDDGEPVQVGPQSYFVVGDNSANSYDSRMFGDLPAKAVLGRASLRFRPPLQFTRLP